MDKRGLGNPVQKGHGRLVLPWETSLRRAALQVPGDLTGRFVTNQGGIDAKGTALIRAGTGP